MKVYSIHVPPPFLSLALPAIGSIGTCSSLRSCIGVKAIWPDAVPDLEETRFSFSGDSCLSLIVFFFMALTHPFHVRRNILYLKAESNNLVLILRKPLSKVMAANSIDPPHICAAWLNLKCLIVEYTRKSI